MTNQSRKLYDFLEGFHIFKAALYFYIANYECPHYDFWNDINYGWLTMQYDYEMSQTEFIHMD